MSPAADSHGPARPAAPARRGSEDLRAWRVRRLRAAGFSLALATDLASDCRVDLHALLQLTDRGCPPELAARIMAPLEGSRPC
jgi:hypothetical protein